MYGLQPWIGLISRDYHDITGRFTS